LKRYISITACCTLTFALASCGVGFRAGPDYERPAQTPSPPTAFSHSDEEVYGPRIDTRWWTVFGDEDLDSLVADVIENNLDIKRATAVVLELRARNTQARAGRLPSLAIEGGYQRQDNPESQSGSRYPAGGDTETFNASLAAYFELDLWGKMSRTHEAARADLLQSVENRRTIMQSVIAEAVTQYLLQESLERRIMILEQMIEAFEKSVRTVEGRYRRGLTSVLELKQAQRTLASAESNLPQLRQELVAAQHRLSIMLGRYPESRPPRMQPQDYFKRLEPVPAGIPSDLMANRPDVRAAEANLRALNARYGIAEASLFPQITLTGSYGYTSSELENLFTPDNALWNFIAGLTQPLFNSGRLLAERSAAGARYRQGVIDYSKTVLSAFAEVENALMIRREQLERRGHIVDYLEKARTAQAIAEKRYERGLVDYLNVLDAMQARYNAEENLVLVDLSILTNRVTLHRALGGSWIDRPGAEEKEQTK